MKFILISLYTICLFRAYVSIESSIDCSQYANDTEVLRSLSFPIPINPPYQEMNKTYAAGFSNGTINYLSLQNETLISRTIFCLQALKVLEVRYSTFCDDQSPTCQLPSEIARWSESLVKIDIQYTRITHLPTSFGKLKRLYELQLRATGLVTVPQTFSSLTSINLIGITFSEFISVPKPIGMLMSLDGLYLGNNVNLRSVQSLNGMQNLTYLSINNCSITSIPLNLPNINYFDMSSNKLTNLNGIQTIATQTRTMKIFTFERNQIRAVPPEFALVKNLTLVRLFNNQLRNLPSTLFGDQFISSLDIRNNLFTPTVLNNIVKKFKKSNPKMQLIY